ncbi:MAG: Rieske 2Fe-2S domain-containing protein [Chloroflexi bacterium]|nr:Rieske 2Fe-2S domain-containing protein [Chloroflexota bacterium]
MLSKEDNELLTGVGPGTPGGELMRRYWHPISPAVDLDINPVRRVRILGEDLTLYRDRQGQLGLIGKRCPHRAVDLQYGIPEDEGLRCPYHGWMFDGTGQCIEQPLEPPDSTFKDRIRLPGYRVEEMGGLIWAYLGPQPAPLLPRWDLFVRPDGFRQIVAHRLPCNWLQVMENRGDRGHGVYTHGRLFQYALERQGRLTTDPAARYNAAMKQHNDRARRGAYMKLQPIFNEYGFTKAHMDSDKSEEESRFWNVGSHCVMFPYTLGDDGPREAIRHSYQIGVPVDDTHTWHMQYFCYVFPEGVEAPEQSRVPYAEVPLRDENGEHILDYVLGQDMVAWYAQGEITDRTEEHLATSDTIVIAYRKLLREQIEVVRQGGEPMNVFRDPATNHHLTPPVHSVEDNMDLAGLFYRENFHKVSQGGWRYIEDDADRYCPDKEILVRLFAESERVRMRELERVREREPVRERG